MPFASYASTRPGLPSGHIVAVMEGASTPADPLPAGNTALISGLGGNSRVLGFYDARAGIVNAGAALTSWSDCRGAGFGPIIDTGTAGWDSVNQLVTFNGSTQHKYSATSSLFDLSTPKSLVLIGALKTGTFTTHGTLINAGETRFLRAANDGSNNLRAELGTSVSTGSSGSGVAASTTRRALLVGYNATPQIRAHVPNRAASTVSHSGTIASESFRIILGARNTAGSQRGACDLRAVLVLDGYFDNTTDSPLIETYGETYHSVTAAI